MKANRHFDEDPAVLPFLLPIVIALADHRRSARLLLSRRNRKALRLKRLLVPELPSFFSRQGPCS